MDSELVTNASLQRVERSPEETAAIIAARERTAYIDALASSLSKMIGLPIMLGGVGTACWIILGEREIGVQASLLIMFIITIGGVLSREATFKSALDRVVKRVVGD